MQNGLGRDESLFMPKSAADMADVTERVEIASKLLGEGLQATLKEVEEKTQVKFRMGLRTSEYEISPTFHPVNMKQYGVQPEQSTNESGGNGEANPGEPSAA